jgi:hypothetical protein
MGTSLRTALSWLQAHGLSDDAECWVLGQDTVQPVTGVTQVLSDMLIITAPPWSDPAPTPLRFAAVCDTLLENYSGGGTLRWLAKPDDPYRGSYVVNPKSAVFFLFLPNEIQIVESHEEKMEQRTQQAIQLTRDIQESQTWPLSQPQI